MLYYYLDLLFSSQVRSAYTPNKRATSTATTAAAMLKIASEIPKTNLRNKTGIMSRLEDKTTTAPDIIDLTWSSYEDDDGDDVMVQGHSIGGVLETTTTTTTSIKPEVTQKQLGYYNPSDFKVGDTYRYRMLEGITSHDYYVEAGLYRLMHRPNPAKIQKDYIFCQVAPPHNLVYSRDPCHFFPSKE